MVIMSFKFPARRYHATPWDAHVNEGRVEWPPSPWRLIRALLAVGYTKLGWKQVLPEEVCSLVAKLSDLAPAYCLPAATLAHSRHYMPTGGNPAKVFDAFVRMQSTSARLLVRYEAELTVSERQALEELLSGLTYLGRAESWVEGELLAESEHSSVLTNETWCEPSSSDEGSPTRLIAPMTSAEFCEWSTAAADEALLRATSAEEAKAQSKGKTLTTTSIKKLKIKTASRFPASVLDALTSDTNQWQSKGWPQPPGTRWLDYAIPDRLLEIPPLSLVARTGSTSATQAVLLSIDGVGKRGSVRPLLPRMLPVMELLHSVAVYKATKELKLGNVPELTGKGDNGQVLQGHRHAHYLPLSLLRHSAGQGKLDHVLIWTPDIEGLTQPAVAALAAIRWAYAKGISDLAINFAGSGTVQELKQQLDLQPQVRKGAANALGYGRVWSSVTPLIFSKHLHTHGKKSPTNQVRDELQQRGFDEPTSIRFWSPAEMVDKGLKGYVVRRQAGKRQPPSANSWAATIEFARPQHGPVTVGYGSHYGLGLFQASDG